jgi:hypothetical protein
VSWTAAVSNAIISANIHPCEKCFTKIKIGGTKSGIEAPSREHTHPRVFRGPSSAIVAHGRSSRPPRFPTGFGTTSRVEAEAGQSLPSGGQRPRRPCGGSAWRS